MNIDLRELLAAIAPQQSQPVAAPSPTIGKFCIVRCRDAGVHCGVVVAVDGSGVVLHNARRIWRWRGANTLSELSLRGASLTEHTRIAEPVAVIHLLACCEVIVCEPAAVSNLEQSRWLA